MLSRSLWCCSSNLRNRIDLYYFFCVTNNKFSESVGVLQNQLTCQNGKYEMKGFQHEQKTIKIDLSLKSMLRRRTSSLPSVCPASWYLEQSHIFTNQLIISTRNYQVPLLPEHWKCDTGHSSNIATHRVVQMEPISCKISRFSSLLFSQP